MSWFVSADHWLHGEGIRHIASPNYNLRPPGTEIDLIVVHGISLPPGEFNGTYIDDLFCNRLDPNAHPYFADLANLRVSAHVLIRRNGEIVQYVSFAHSAWHAGRSAFLGRIECNDYAIGIELEGADTIPYTAPQYTKLADLIHLLQKHWPGICPERVTGHSEVAPGRKTDPGPAFEWQRLRKLLM